MKLSDIPNFDVNEGVIQAYAKSLKKLGTLSSFILIVYPTLLVFLITFFIGNAFLLSAMFAAYWAMFLYLERKRYWVDFRIRSVNTSFWKYVFHSPFSRSYLKFSLLPILIFSGELIGYYVKMTAYEGAALIDLVIALLVVALLFDPWLLKQSKHARLLESAHVISRLNDIASAEGIPEVIPRIIDGTTYRVASTCTVGIFKPVICITDYAMENMSEEEVAVVLSREISRIKRRDSLKIGITAISSTAVVMIMVGIVAYWSTLPAMIPFLQKISPPIVEGWTVITLVGLLFLPAEINKRSELAADRLAVHYSSPSLTMETIVKLAHLNWQPVVAFSPFRLSLLTRIMKIDKMQGDQFFRTK